MFVHMLGVPFYVRTDEGREVDEIFTSPMLRNRSVKLLHLLACLLYHHGEMVDRSRILAMLYGEDHGETACNNLRAVIFRLRKVLKKIGLPDGDYILSRKGTYGWNEKLCPLEIDAEIFGAQAGKALAMEDGKTGEKIQALMEAVSHYKGSFLPLFENETWVIQEELKYRENLGECMEVLYRLLAGQGREKEILPICTSLLSVVPDEKWYLLQIRAFLSMKEPTLAYRVYEEAVKVMVDTLGRQPSPEFISIFRSINKNPEKSLETIGNIREMLDDRVVPGRAYYCSFPSFIDAYRVSGRLMQRNRCLSFLILCTVTTSRGHIIKNKSKLEKISGQLKEAIMESARSSDMMTSYSLSQYLLLLNGITREGCSIVTGRIDQKFRQFNASSNYMVNYYVSSIKDVPPLSAITEYRQDDMAPEQMGWEI